MSTDSQAQISELIDLARDKSDHAREMLVENIADLFLSEEGRLSEHERSLMSDILCKLIRNIEKEVKTALSERLADIETAPHDLIRMLGGEDIDVARPILEKSQVLKDPDLVEIIKRRTDEHRLAIALREGISPEVAEALVIYGDEDAVEALLRNKDAELSRSAMEYLVAESRRVDRFQEPLIARGDLPPEFAHRMFWWVSAALRRHILANYAIAEHELDAAIEDATKHALSREEDTNGALQMAVDLVKRMQDNGELTVPFLVQALRQQRTLIFVAGLAAMAGISVIMAWRIFSDRGGESLAVVCKAIGMERSDFSAVFLLICQARAGGKPQDPSVLSDVIEIYDRVDRQAATTALTYWQRDQNYQAAIDDLQ